MNEITIQHILIPSLFRLYNKNYDYIFCGVSERNICARLTHRMEIIMREFFELTDLVMNAVGAFGGALFSAG